MKRMVFYMLITVLLIFTFASLSIAASQPKGAKALFDSGEGTAVGIATGKADKPRTAEPATVKPEKYTGIFHQLVLLKDDGSFQVVPKSRVFKTGERVKMLVRVNRPGYLTIRNIGTSGNMNILFNDYVDSLQMVEIPKAGSIRFVGAPGTEIVEVMLSNEPLYPTTPSAPSAPVTAQNQPPQYAPPPSTPSYGSSVPPPSYGSTTPPPPSYGSTQPPAYGANDPITAPPPPSSSSDIANLPPPPPQALAYDVSGGKGAKGAKDLVLSDGMDNKYTVVDRKTWRPTTTGVKDLVIESQSGSNYGVIPVSTLQNGGVLISEIKLKHR